MRHITLVTNAKNPLVPRVIASISGNSFGDQIVEFKKHSNRLVVDGKRTSGYQVMHVERMPEGEHLDETAIKRFYNTMIRGKV